MDSEIGRGRNNSANTQVINSGWKGRNEIDEEFKRERRKSIHDKSNGKGRRGMKNKKNKTECVLRMENQLTETGIGGIH